MKVRPWRLNIYWQDEHCARHPITACCVHSKQWGLFFTNVVCCPGRAKNPQPDPSIEKNGCASFCFEEK